jgi:outer membrane immunogenic protein
MGFLRRLFSVAATALAAAIATPAFAGGAASPSATPTWTGFYLGGDVGLLFANAHFNQPAPPGQQETSIGTIDGRPSYGTFVGFNYQVAPWAVVGVEGDFNWFSAANYRYLGGVNDFLQQSRFVDSVTARVGGLVRPDTMIYGKLGPAWLNVSGLQGIFGQFNQNLTGIQGGIGIEGMITRNVIARGEVSYTYADQLTVVRTPDVYRPSILMAQVGLSYKFDPLWDPAFAAKQSPPLLFKNPLVYKAPPSSADPPADPPAGPPLLVGDPHWTGLEAGGFVSVNGNQILYTDTLMLSPNIGPFTDLKVGGGWLVGANLKYWRIVVGIEGSGNYENANFQNPPGAGGIYRFANMDRFLAFTGRAGFLITPDTLLYAKAGPTNFRMTPNPAYWNAIVPNTTGGTLFAGYTAGGGIETFVLPNLSFRIEAMYTHTDNKVTLNGLVPAEFTLQPSLISAMVGLVLHL